VKKPDTVLSDTIRILKLDWARVTAAIGGIEGEVESESDAEVGNSGIFGYSLSAGNFGKSGEADLVVGARGESIGGVGTRAPSRGSTEQRAGFREPAISSGIRAVPGFRIPDSAESDDSFGSSLAP